MIRHSVVRRNFRSHAPYVGPLPTPTGPFSRPSVSGAEPLPTYHTHELLVQAEQLRLQHAMDEVFSIKYAVHKGRLSTIIPTPE